MAFSVRCGFGTAAAASITLRLAAAAPPARTYRDQILRGVCCTLIGDMNDVDAGTCFQHFPIRTSPANTVRFCWSSTERQPAAVPRRRCDRRRPRYLADVRMHCDLAPAQGLWQQRDDYTCLLGSCQDLRYEDRALAELVNPLVITETGTLKPIAYDFEGQVDLTSIDDLPSDRLRDYKRHRLPRQQSLVSGALVGPAGSQWARRLVRPLRPA